MADQFQVIRDVSAIAAEVLQCANSWEPRIKLIGNVSARELRRLANWALATLDALETSRRLGLADEDEIAEVEQANAATAQAMAMLVEWDSAPIGTEVIVTRDDGSELRTKTRSEPWMVCGAPVIAVEGISGGYSLERVRRA